MVTARLCDSQVLRWPDIVTVGGPSHRDPTSCCEQPQDLRLPSLDGHRMAANTGPYLHNLLLTEPFFVFALAVKCNRGNYLQLTSGWSCFVCV